MIRMKRIDVRNDGMTYVRGLYESAFPEDERREWSSLLSLCDACPAFELRVIYDGDREVGFITVWRWDDWRYVEHFAVDASCRGRGTGADVLRALLAEDHRPVILEVEIPVDEISRRRVEFYRRLGFVLHDNVSYMQPSYGEGRKPLPMYLMTYGVPQDRGLSAVVDILYREVYGVKLPRVDEKES